MVYSSVGALIIATICMAIWSRSNAEPSRFVSDGSPGAIPWPQIRWTMTDALASTWIGVSVYGGLMIAMMTSSPAPLHAFTVVVPLVAACAALERWRWARTTLQGAALVILADAVVAIIQSFYTDRLPWHALFGRADYWPRVLTGFTGSPWFGGGVIALAAITLGWMRLGSVKHDFEYRKRAKTRGYQLWIAGVLVALFAIGVNSTGLSRISGGSGQNRQNVAQAGGLERIASNPCSTTSRFGRR